MRMPSHVAVVLGSRAAEKGEAVAEEVRDKLGGADGAGEVSGASNADAPHVLANAGLEVRPWKRLRIVDSWTTNRYHDAAFGALTELILVSPGTGPRISDVLNTRPLEEITAVLRAKR